MSEKQEQAVTWALGLVAMGAAGLGFLFATFETKSAAAATENALIRLEKKVDALLLRQGGNPKQFE